MFGEGVNAILRRPVPYLHSLVITAGHDESGIGGEPAAGQQQVIITRAYAYASCKGSGYTIEYSVWNRSGAAVET